MIVDANLLLYARDADFVHHEAARAWLVDELNAPRLVGLPWLSLGAFLRVSTHPRIFHHPLTAAQAWTQVEDWLAVETVSVPGPGPGYARILGELLIRHNVTGNLLPDAQLAALALEHGLTVYSADTDFARFTEVRWVNPIAT